jgi:hypothetical protein
MHIYLLIGDWFSLNLSKEVKMSYERQYSKEDYTNILSFAFITISISNDLNRRVLQIKPDIRLYQLL